MTVLTDELLASFADSITGVETAVTMPPVIYTSEEFLAFERRSVFAREWLCVGRASRIPSVGDYFTTTANSEPIVVARAKDGAVHVFSAVCQHRGMQVVDGAGTCTKLTCPYHQWSYDLTGRLLGAPAMERTAGFEKKDFPLPALKVELWQGFIFVNLDRDADALAPTLAGYEAYIEHYELEHAVCPGTFTLTDMPWNWKVMFENFNDGYHANRLHHTIQDFCPSELAAFPVEWEPKSNVIFRTNGYTHIDGGFNATTKALLPVFPQLTEAERWRSTFALMPPSLCFGTAPDQAFFFIVRPKTVDTIDVEIGYLLHPSALDHPMFDHLMQMSDAGVQVFVRQDQDATTKVQRGMRSRFAARGRYSWQEASHVQLNRWLVQRYRDHWPSPTRTSPTRTSPTPTSPTPTSPTPTSPTPTSTEAPS
jgi:phenylpropionate dioxygenase-like ring-hydroxylating dioxygenase large terminal subunit